MENSSGYADAHGYFTKENVAEIGINALLITSGSKVGEEARNIIHQGGDESRNSPLQNAKARMQILRVLGLVSTDYGSEIYAITKLGKLMISQVLSNNPNFGLLRELFMGISSSTEVYEHNCSLGFNCWLGIGICYALSKLDYRISTDEMPMLTTYDIKDIEEFISEAKENREQNIKFTETHPHFPKRQNGQPQRNVSNLTRTINQILRVCDIIDSKTVRIGTTNYYTCTEFGRQYVDSIKAKFNNLDFLTAMKFRKFNNIPKQRETCHDAYNGILRRSGVDTTLSDSNIMFSPYQMLPETTVEWFIGNIGDIRHHPEIANERISAINSMVSARELRLSTFYKDVIAAVAKIHPSDQNLYTDIQTKISDGTDIETIANELCTAHQTDDKEIFYPFIHSLLRIIGLNCMGEVGRYDAYVKFEEHTIPVEIKSNTETSSYNAKGIRQAIENKILSFDSEKENDLEFASLVVGFSHPTNDAEVKTLIDGAFEKFKIKVLALDLLSLVKMTINVIGNKKSIDFSRMFTQHGLITE